jgi:hypothetical protein
MIALFFCLPASIHLLLLSAAAAACCLLRVLVLRLQPEEAEDDVECYTPFQFMLQFMLQPLLVESGSTAGGAFIPALRKMCAYIKYTADRAVSGAADVAGRKGCQRC